MKEGRENEGQMDLASSSSRYSLSPPEKTLHATLLPAPQKDGSGSRGTGQEVTTGSRIRPVGPSTCFGSHGLAGLADAAGARSSRLKVATERKAPSLASLSSSLNMRIRCASRMGSLMGSPFEGWYWPRLPPNVSCMLLCRVKQDRLRLKLGPRSHDFSGARHEGNRGSRAGAVA